MNTRHIWFVYHTVYIDRTSFILWPDFTSIIILPDKTSFILWPDIKNYYNMTLFHKNNNILIIYVMKLNNIQWNLTIDNETEQYKMELNNIQWNWTICNETKIYVVIQSEHFYSNTKGTSM